jgi:hypothetical protein
MCVSPKSERSKQKAVPLKKGKPGKAKKNCPLPRLVSLTVVGASQIGASAYGEVVDTDCVIDVTATTEPDTPDIWANLTWSVGAPIETNNGAVLDRLAAGTRRVTVTLTGGQPDSNELSLDVTLVDLTDLAFQLPLKLAGPRRWKAYESNATARVVATTTPDQDAVWSQLRWDSGAAVVGHNNQHDVTLTPARDVTITATLGQICPKPLPAQLHICVWPLLHVHRELFDSMDVLNDGTADFAALFDKQWIEGRPDPAVNVPAATCQSILWYAAGSTISVTADFKVTRHPTDTENVTIVGKAQVGTVDMEWWAQNVVVTPAAVQVSIPLTAATNPLAPGVDFHDPFTIEWWMLDYDGTTWIHIGTTTHLLYVALQAPTETLAYWTLLDASCRRAQGQTTENGFVPAAFQALTGTTGDGAGLRRKGDGVATSYYLQGVNTSGSQVEPSVYSTRGILSRADGTGRCGGWADLLMHMFRLHGVVSDQLWLIRDNDPNAADMSRRFLVKNCAFAGVGTSTISPYTHIGQQGGGECTKLAGLPGQGKTNPQFDFGDHVVVAHNDIIYDPSYGVSGYTSVLAYETAAIDGLGTNQRGQYNFAIGGTPQFIAADTSPGYIEVTTASSTWDTVGMAYSLSGRALRQNRLNRVQVAITGAGPLPDGVTIYIPRAAAAAAGQWMLKAHWI